eukprot:1160084-Pelagomonas_calceolata.AAC.3
MGGTSKASDTPVAARFGWLRRQTSFLSFGAAGASFSGGRKCAVLGGYRAVHCAGREVKRQTLCTTDHGQGLACNQTEAA